MTAALTSEQRVLSCMPRGTGESAERAYLCMCTAITAVVGVHGASTVQGKSKKEC